MSLMCRWKSLSLLSHTSTTRCIAATVAIACSPASVNAVNIDSIQVSENDGVYTVYVSAELPVPAKYIRQVLTDYDHLYRISNSIIESEVLARYGNEGALVRSKLLCCTAVFCQEVERVEEVEVVDDNTIIVSVVPEYSEFRSGLASWQLLDNGDATVLQYDASIEPDFFIPPLLGVRLVKQHIYEEFRDAFFRLGHIANVHYEREWDNDFIPPKMVAEMQPCDDSLNAAAR